MFGTQFLNDCPQELWDALDAAAIADELGAAMVKLNGPRYWILDGMGAKVNAMEPVLREFNGLLMRRLATIDLGDQLGVQPYTEVHVDRGAVFFFDAGKPVYELVDTGRPGLRHAGAVRGGRPGDDRGRPAGPGRRVWRCPTAGRTGPAYSTRSWWSTPPATWPPCSRTSSRTPTPCPTDPASDPSPRSGGQAHRRVRAR